MKASIRFFVFLIIALFALSCNKAGVTTSEMKLIPVKVGKEYQYIDRQGKIAINPQFSIATVFRNGLALVKTSGNEPKWGYISEDGKYAIAPNYNSATIFSEEMAWVVSENTAPTAINSMGEIKITLQDAEFVKIFKNGYAAFSISDSSGAKWGFVDNTGAVVINPQFTNTGNFSNGKCAVENTDGKWGYIDKSGGIVINYQFDNASEFKDGKAVVYSDGKAGVIDEQGKYLINPQFSNMVDDGGRYLIEQDGKWGWCDQEGKIIINPQFSQAFPFMSNELAPVQSGKSWGYVDSDAKIIINPQFDFAFSHNGSLALVLSGSKIGFIDEEGKYVINPQYDNIDDDLTNYMHNGQSQFEMVETDFFNISTIVNRLNLVNPEGLSLSGSLADVTAKFKITEEQFSQYATEHQLIINEMVTNDAKLNFYVFASAYMEIPDGWYSKFVFNPDASIDGFAYEIKIGGRGTGKEKDVLQAIEQSLDGYQKDEEQSNEELTVYSKENQLVKFYIQGSRIIVILMNEVQETTPINEYD
jgi:hypothetical protein